MSAIETFLYIFSTLRQSRLEEAFQWSLAGLKRCARTQDAHIARGLIREIVRMARSEWLEVLAVEFPDLVLEAARLPGFVEFLTPGVETPLEALTALSQGLLAQPRSEATSL